MFEAVPEGIPDKLLSVVLGLSSSIDCSKSCRDSFGDEPCTVLLFPRCSIDKWWVASGPKLLVGESFEVHGGVLAPELLIVEDSE